MGLSSKAAFFSYFTIAKIFHKNLPLTVIFNITDRCNSKCTYCYASYYNRKKEELKLNEVKNVIAELKKMHCKRVSFGGGEPLLREDIGEIIDFVKGNSMDCVINSNGYLVPEKIDIIKKADALVLSLDGDEASHDICRGKGSFDKVMKAIECACENHVSMHTNTVLHKNNLNSIDFILKLAKKYNYFAEFNISIDCFNPADNKENHKATDESIRQALKRLIQYKKEGENILFSKKAFEYSLIWPTYRQEAFFDSPPDFKHTVCQAGRFFCVIDTNGDLYPCPHLIDKMKVKNVKEGFQNAFSKLTDHNCKACYQVYHNEFNLLFNYDPAVIYNYIKNSLKMALSINSNGKLKTN